jgi:hypothetical protein
MVLVKKSISGKKFDNLKHYGMLDAQVLYVVNIGGREKNSKMYAWSDDGDGFFFYPSMAEFRAAGHL